MFILGSGVNIRGGFWGATMLRGYRYHDENGVLKDSGDFYDFSEIDPPDIGPTTTTTEAPVLTPGQPTNLSITVHEPLPLPGQPTNLNITVEDA